MVKVRKILFLILFSFFVGAYFTKSGYKNVTQIMPEVTRAPIQTQTSASEKIVFTKGGYKYELTPLYDYVISALIVSRMNYGWFSAVKVNKIFPVDLCLLWGSNVSSGLYRNKSINFSQDGRWYYVRWYGDIKFNFEEAANNHLIIKEKGLLRKVKNLSRGDQVKIKGMLVNVRAANLGESDILNPESLTWNSSTTRSDSGAGACEIIYVRDVEVLKKANPLSHYLYTLSYYGLLILIAWSIIDFFAKPI